MPATVTSSICTPEGLQAAEPTATSAELAVFSATVASTHCAYSRIDCSPARKQLPIPVLTGLNVVDRHQSVRYHYAKPQHVTGVFGFSQYLHARYSVNHFAV